MIAFLLLLAQAGASPGELVQSLERPDQADLEQLEKSLREAGPSPRISTRRRPTNSRKLSLIGTASNIGAIFYTNLEEYQTSVMLLNNSIQLFTDVFLSPQLNLKNKTQLSKHLLLHSSLLAGKQKDKKQKEKPKKK